MFELTLSITIDKQKCLTQLQKKLENEIQSDDFIVVCHNQNGRTFLAVAINDLKKEYLKSKILEAVQNIIINEYKYSFFREQLISIGDNVMINPFLKAIAVFDADCDFDIIKKEINLSGEILIDSFFYFKLQELKQRWEKTAAIILKNGVLQSESSMIQVVKYLADSSENFVLVTTVKVFENKIQLKNYNSIKSFKTDSAGVSKFLTEMILLNPLKINLIKNFDDNVKNHVCYLLDEIFGEKIYLEN